jgi:hypothetical protein
VLYYLTLFQSAEGEASFAQGFENFNSFDAIFDEGWQSSINRVTTSAKADGTRALYFKNTGEYITTPIYQAPVTTISFWVNAFSASVTEVGHIDIEAWNGTEWVTSEAWRTIITKTTKGKLFYVNFAQEDNYTQFRLTYTDNGGAGAALDAFTATCSRNITYIHKGKDLAIDATIDETMCYYDFTNLQENSTYYFTIQSSDITKGCEEHISAATEAIEVKTATTSDEKDKDKNKNQLPIVIDTINYDAPTHIVYLSNPKTGNALCIYNTQGKIVYTCPTVDGQTEYIIPVEQLQKGTMYVIKYITNDKIRRKEGWVKFIL